MKSSKALKKEWGYFKTGLLIPVMNLLILKNEITKNQETPILDKFSKTIPESIFKRDKRDYPASTGLGIIVGGLLPLTVLAGLLARPFLGHNPDSIIATNTLGQHYKLTPISNKRAKETPEFMVITRQTAIEKGLIEQRASISSPQ